MNRAARRSLAKQPMYQAVVRERDEKGIERDKPVGPRSNNRGIAEALCESVNREVAAGRERKWFDARVVRVDTIQ